jgi:hypothetical protein
MTVRTLIRRPTAHLPLAMSGAAFAMIVWFVAMHGVTRQADESAQARLWLLFVVGQVPLIGRFAFTWLQRARRSALVVLVLQIAGIVFVAVGPLWALGGL